MRNLMKATLLIIGVIALLAALKALNLTHTSWSAVFSPLYAAPLAFIIAMLVSFVHPE